MMGLALGVDYSLLIVSRFREELAAGAEPLRGGDRTRRTAGRTTIFAGSTLFLSMFVSISFLPGSLLVSLAGTVIIVVCISVLVATLVAPPLLALLGANDQPLANRQDASTPDRSRRDGVRRTRPCAARSSPPRDRRRRCSPWRRRRSG